jgi:hypothetical protein
VSREETFFKSEQSKPLNMTLLGELIEDRAAQMTVGRYRITSPGVAFVLEDGRHSSHTVPTGAIVTVESLHLGTALITWRGVKATMIAQDLAPGSAFLLSDRFPFP